MNRKITPYIYILFFSFFFSEIYSQNNSEFNLEIKSNIVSENEIIKSINYRKKFSSITSLKKTKDSVLNVLKEKGFYTLLIDRFYQQENNLTYFLKLGIKLKEIHIKVKPKDQELLREVNLKSNKNILSLKIEKLKPTLNLVSNYLIERGQLFSKVRIVNSVIKNQILYSELEIENTKKRIINKTIVKGYNDFPISFVNHYLNLNKNQVLNENKMNEISSKINQLNFVSEIKKPEILFSKDSTLLYIYLKKKQSNSFDGLINFSSENKKLNFRGYLDLNLTNILNKGEEFSINWKNNSNNKQDFTLKTKIPYLFNSKFSSEASFNLYRSDSTFSNTSSTIILSYPINTHTDFSILYNSESSINNIATNNISSFDKKMIGIGFNYKSHKKNKFNIGFDIYYGVRNSKTKTNQYLLEFNASRIIKTSKKTQLLIKNKSSFLFSNSYLENELFREGGANSIRGFNNQSIFTPKYTYINSEFRLISKSKSYIYSIHDLGVFNINLKNSVLYSLGLGYNYMKNSNSIDISYVFGATTGATHSLKPSTLSIKVLTLF